MEVNGKMLKSSSSTSIFLGLITAPLLCIHSASASEYALKQGSVRLSYDPITLENNEPLGLLGIHALINNSEYSYIGVSGFGAVTGERGGFLAGGYTAGLHLPLNERFNADLSIFLGAGGGGAAPQGGGLMLREQMGINYNASSYQVGTGVSRIHFPNGEIDSVQPYLSLQIPFTTFYAPGWETDTLFAGSYSQPLYDHTSSFAVSFKRYHGSSLFRSVVQPASTISVIGVDWQHHMKESFYYTLSAHGAYEGSADGYAEVMAGAGSRWSLTPDTAFGMTLAAGTGGGGNVDTGGGMLASLTLNMEQKLPGRLLLSIQGGYTGAIEGRFGGTVIGITLGTLHNYPSTDGWMSEPASLDYAPAHYRLRMVQQRYRAATTISGDNPAIDLTGLQIDKQVADNFYLTGQAMAAWRNEAGGYASGMMGGGLSLPLSRYLALNCELLAGAAGGGGIDVGDGLLMGGMISAVAHLSNTLDLEVGSGRIAAYDGGLDTRQVTLTIAYRFTHPER